MPSPRIVVSMLLAAWLLPPHPVAAQGMRTVVVPAESGVVVAPRSAAPRLAARPAGVPPASGYAPGPVLLPATGVGLVAPALALLPLAAVAALFAGNTAGSGGSGTSGPARTR